MVRSGKNKTLHVGQNVSHKRVSTNKLSNPQIIQSPIVSPVVEIRNHIKREFLFTVSFLHEKRNTCHHTCQKLTDINGRTIPCVVHVSNFIICILYYQLSAIPHNWQMKRQSYYTSKNYFEVHGDGNKEITRYGWGTVFTLHPIPGNTI